MDMYQNNSDSASFVPYLVHLTIIVQVEVKMSIAAVIYIAYINTTCRQIAFLRRVVLFYIAVCVIKPFYP